ncbi:acyltransferase family protein [Companilactobacillus insicii]|uniref:acyltransferase family protein n=1 Tax=Companilactobacillus insicii TaxID=1732567 RepID=UPI000F78A999|nr:acyltransferase [Companilactobacillus insicii]
MKIRNSAIEWLRILSMFFIVLGHFAWQTNWSFNATNLFLKSTIEILWIGGKLGVNIFVLISGYFLVNSRFKWRSFFNVWFVSYFYAVIIYIITLVFKIEKFNVKNLVKTLFLSSTGYLNWFVTAYLIMYILSPFLNIAFRNIDKYQFRYLLIIMMTIFSFFTTVFKNPSVGTNGNDAMWVMVVYSFGSYIGLYEEDLKRFKKSIYGLLLVGSLLLSVISIYMINIVRSNLSLFSGTQSYADFVNGTSPLQLLSAISLFILVLYAKPYTNNIVNKIASTSFAVYLIHANLLIVDWLWITVVNGSKYSNSYFAIFYGLGVSLIIYISCSLIDYMRQFIFGKFQNRIVTSLSEIARELMNKFNIKI